MTEVIDGVDIHDLLNIDQKTRMTQSTAFVELTPGSDPTSNSKLYLRTRKSVYIHDNAYEYIYNTLPFDHYDNHTLNKSDIYTWIMRLQQVREQVNCPVSIGVMITKLIHWLMLADDDIVFKGL